VELSEPGSWVHAGASKPELLVDGGSILGSNSRLTPAPLTNPEVQAQLSNIIHTNEPSSHAHTHGHCVNSGKSTCSEGYPKIEFREACVLPYPEVGKHSRQDGSSIGEAGNFIFRWQACRLNLPG